MFYNICCTDNDQKSVTRSNLSSELNSRNKNKGVLCLTIWLFVGDILLL